MKSGSHSVRLLVRKGTPPGYVLGGTHSCQTNESGKEVTIEPDYAQGDVG
jgi:hypothetical protein